MAEARYRYNSKEKRCFILYESTKATKEEWEKEQEEFALPILDDIIEKDKIRSFIQKDGSHAFEFELEKVESKLSFKTTFKHPLLPKPDDFHGDGIFDYEHKNALLEIEELSATLITATLRNVDRQVDTVYPWPTKVEDGITEYLKPDYGTVVYDKKTDTYGLEYGKPYIFNTYWDEFDKEKDWLFFFDFFIHQVNKDKDEKKPWLYYADDFSPAISRFIYKVFNPWSKLTREQKDDLFAKNIGTSPYLPYSKGREKEIKDDLTWRERNALKGHIVQLPGQDGTMLKDWKENSYKTSHWRYINSDESWWEEVDKEWREKLGFDFFDFLRRVPYDKRKEAVKMVVEKGLFDRNAEDFLTMEEFAENIIGEKLVKYTDPRILDYDFAFETKDNWVKSMGELPALVISFLPTMFYGRKVPRDKKLTGTVWFKQLWEVFIQHDVPLVLRCYPGFIFENLWRYHNDYTKRISAITELPKCVDGREVGGSSMLVYFNCPWLGKGIGDRVKWDFDCDAYKRKDSLIRLWMLNKITIRQLFWYKKPHLDPRFKYAYCFLDFVNQEQKINCMILAGLKGDKRIEGDKEFEKTQREAEKDLKDFDDKLELKKEVFKTIKEELTKYSNQ